jgi:hypothetical protein
MTVNMKCFKESVKSDLSVFLSICLLIALCGIVTAILCYSIIIGFPIAANSLEFVIPIIKSVMTAYGIYICVCLSIIVLQSSALYTMSKNDIDKYTTFVVAGLLTLVILFFYLGYIQMSNLPVCSDTWSGTCRIVYEAQYPSIIIETILVCLWLWLSTPLLVAYKRCKE